MVLLLHQAWLTCTQEAVTGLQTPHLDEGQRKKRVDCSSSEIEVAILEMLFIRFAGDVILLALDQASTGKQVLKSPVIHLFFSLVVRLLWQKVKVKVKQRGWKHPSLSNNFQLLLGDLKLFPGQRGHSGYSGYRPGWSNPPMPSSVTCCKGKKSPHPGLASFPVPENNHTKSSLANRPSCLGIEHHFPVFY